MHRREMMSRPVPSHVHRPGGEIPTGSIAVHDALMVDAEPERLSIELVNRYHAVKRAGLI